MNHSKIPYKSERGRIIDFMQKFDYLLGYKREITTVLRADLNENIHYPCHGIYMGHDNGQKFNEIIVHIVVKTREGKQKNIPFTITCESKNGEFKIQVMDTDYSKETNCLLLAEKIEHLSKDIDGEMAKEAKAREEKAKKEIEEIAKIRKSLQGRFIRYQDGSYYETRVYDKWGNDDWVSTRHKNYYYKIVPEIYVLQKNEEYVDMEKENIHSSNIEEYRYYIKFLSQF